MTRNNAATIVLMTTAVIGALVLLSIVGAWLLQATLGWTMAGTGGVGAVAGGVSSNLFLVLAMVPIVIVLAILIIRRSRR